MINSANICLDILYSVDTFHFPISFSVPSVCSNIYCTTLSEERMPVSSEAENVSWFEILEQFMDESFDGEEENNSYVVSEEDQLQQDAGELKVNRTHDLTPQLRYNYLADKYFYVSSKYFFPFQFVVEGILMTAIGCMGIAFNLVSFVFYARQKCHRTFHRYLVRYFLFRDI